MILPMSRVRIMGPRQRLDQVLAALQDLGLLHLSAPEAPTPLEPVQLTPTQARAREHLRAALADTDQALKFHEPAPVEPAPRCVAMHSRRELVWRPSGIRRKQSINQRYVRRQKHAEGDAQRPRHQLQ